MMYRSMLMFVITSLLLLVGCGSETNNPQDDEGSWKPTPYEHVNTFDGVTMEIQEGTVSATGLTLLFTNETDKEGIYGDPFTLEKKIDGSWFEIPVILEEYGFNDIGYNLPPNGESEWEVDWEWLYGPLDSGEYRIMKEISDFREPGDYDEHYFAAPFTID